MPENRNAGGEEMIIHTVIGNRTHPEYGVASIPFPITTKGYPRIIEMLEALEVGDVLKSDCHIAELESPLPVLKCVENTNINVDELDYLAKRLDSFSDYEFRQFQAMAAKNGYFQLKDLINLTFSCQQVTVISDFSDSMCEAAAGISAEKLGAIIRSTSLESTEQIMVLAQDGFGLMTSDNLLDAAKSVVSAADTICNMNVPDVKNREKHTDGEASHQPEELTEA